MQHTVILVEKLGKQYNIGTARNQSFSFQHTLLDAIKKPLNRLISGTGFRTSANYEPFWALKDVSFEVKPGEVVGIIGRNGSGKSTLLKILSRIVEPTTGRAIVNGRVGSLLEIGMGFHPELTGRENIYLSGAVLGMKRNEIDGRFDEIVDFSGVEAFIDTPVKRYSSGMYVRLAFAVAAQMEPEVLIIDEVLAVGDQAFQKKCIDRMEFLAQEGRTVLFVSHSMESIRSLCDTAILLDQGRVTMHGPSNDVVDAYLNLVDEDVDAGDIAEHHSDINRILARIPEDPVFRLNDLEVLQDGQATFNVSTARPINLRIKYEILEECPGFYLIFRLYSHSGHLVFESLHNGNEAELPIVTPGNYISIAEIPANFLAPMPYELWVGAAVYNVGACLPEMIRLSLIVHQDISTQRAYPHRRVKGEIAPVIPWITELQDIEALSTTEEAELDPPSPMVFWDNLDQAPGNDTIKVSSISIRSKDGIVSGTISRHSGFDVAIEYWLLHTTPPPNVVLLVKNGSNESVLQSTNWHDNGNHDQLARKGPGKTVCTIAENLLSPGRFSVTVIISTNANRDEIRIHEAITIDVTETIGHCSEEGAPGPIQPSLPWRAEILKDSPIPERIWEDLPKAPGNAHFQLYVVRVRDARGVIRAEIPASENYSVEVEYFNWNSNLDLVMAIILHQSNGESLVLHVHDKNYDWGQSPKPCSRHRVICDVPGGASASGRLSISILMWCDQEAQPLLIWNVITVNIGPQATNSQKCTLPLHWRYERPGWPPVAEQTWDDHFSASHNSDFVYRGMRVRDTYGNINALIPPGQKFYMEIDIWSVKQDASLEMSLCIMDWYNNCLIKAFSNWNRSYLAKSNQKGLFRSVCTIPGNLLASGRYYITAQVWDSDSGAVVESPAPVSIDIDEEEDANSVASSQVLSNSQIDHDLPQHAETLFVNPYIATH